MKKSEKNVNTAAARGRSPSNYEDSKSTFSRQISANNPAGHSLSGTSHLQGEGEQDGQFEAKLRQHQIDALAQSFTQNLYDRSSMSPSCQPNQELVLLGAEDRASPKKSHIRGRNPQKGLTAAQLKQEEYEMQQLQLQMAHAHQYQKKQVNSGKINAPAGKEKSKSKKSKQSNKLVLQENLMHSLEAHGVPHYGVKANSSKNKAGGGQRVSIQNAFLVAAAQTQNATHSHHSPSKRRTKALPLSSENYESGANSYLPQGIHGQNGQIVGGLGRRVLVSDSGNTATPDESVQTSQKASHKAIGQKRSSQIIGNGGGSNNNSIKKNMIQQNPIQNQNFNHEKQQHTSVPAQNYSKSGTKHNGHRKNQPVPIDTFNIVSNRRKSLVKQVNEANASTDAMISNAFANLSNSQQFLNGDLNPGSLNGSNAKSSTQNAGLILPQIQPNSKTGMNQYTKLGSSAAPRTDKHASTVKTSELQTQMMVQTNALQSQSHTNTHYQSIDNQGNIGGFTSDNKDLKRRTTGSIFQTPNSQVINNLIHNQTINQQSKEQALSVHTSNHLSKRIKNIISPIQSSTNALEILSNQQYSKYSVNQSGRDSPRPLRQSYNSKDQPIGARSSNAQQKSSQMPDVMTQLHSEQQSIMENTMLFDSMVNKINPRSHGSKGNTDARTHYDQSIQKHAKLIGKSGPIANPSRLEKVSAQSFTKMTGENHYGVIEANNNRSSNLVTTPDYEVNPNYHADIIAATPSRTLQKPGGKRFPIGGSEQQNTANFDGSVTTGNEQPILISQQEAFANPSVNQSINGIENVQKSLPGQNNGYSGTVSSGNDGDENQDSSDEEEDDSQNDQSNGAHSAKSLHTQPQELTAMHLPDDARATAPGAVTPTGKSQNFAQHVKQQLNLRQKDAGGTNKERKKGKKHKRQNTHHHYHIDFNFEQVNNILVSYGGMGLHQQLKQQIKKDNSKANVSLSLGVVNGQFNNQQRGNSIQIPNLPGVTPSSPSKRQLHQNGLMLPELIINKNKINFGNKSFKLNVDDMKLSSRQQRDIVAGQSMNSNNFVTQGASGVKNSLNGQKTKRKKHKKDAIGNVLIDESNIIMAPGRKGNEKYKTPKRQQISQSLNPSVVSHINKISATEGREPIKILKQNQVNLQQDLRLVRGPGFNEEFDGNNSKRQSNVNSRASRDSRGINASRGENKAQIKLNINENNQVPDKVIGELNKSVNIASGFNPSSSPTNGQQWHSAKRSAEVSGQDMIRKSDSKTTNPNSTMAHFQLSQQQALTQQNVYVANNAHHKPPISGGVPQIGPPGNSLKVRQKQHLQVITKSGNIGQQNIETPKKYFNVKAQQSGQKVKMAVMEHHSAGLRNSQVKNQDTDDGSPSKNNTQFKGNFNTLSQISSVVSADGEKSNLKKENHPVSAMPTRQIAGGSLIQPRQKQVKNIIREQEKKLKLLDDQNKRTHKMIEQFNTANRASEAPDEMFSADAVNLGCSPLLPKGDKILQPEKLEKLKITDFELYECIGIGNFGKVHKSLNKVHNRICALKILKKESVAAMKHVDHIVNEREVLQYLNDKNGEYALDNAVNQEDDRYGVRECPFLMDIYSSFQDKENLYFELEYIQGCSLLSQIREYNKDVQQGMVYYTAEVLHSFQYLHQNNIIYRDLKPENIVISMTERGHIKIVDFGFAKRLKDISQRTYTNCGTPAYIAPEILRGHNGHGFEVDIWSLGVLMVEIISGQTPFHADTTQGIYEKIHLCKPQYNKFVTQNLRDLLNKIFVPDPELRIRLEEIKNHSVYKDFDWTYDMRDRYIYASAPFIPQEPVFNEKADRDSVEEEVIKPRNLLAAIMGNPMNDLNAKPTEQKKMEFNEDHYNKFQREDEKTKGDNNDNNNRQQTRRRQNPLGDFKFKKINELF